MIYPVDQEHYLTWTTEAWSLSEVITFILWSRSLITDRWNHTFKVSALFFKAQFPSKTQNLKIILFWRNLLSLFSENTATLIVIIKYAQLLFIFTCLEKRTVTLK